jgi:hypothetical protein
LWFQQCAALLDRSHHNLLLKAMDGDADCAVGSNHYPVSNVGSV